MAWQQIQDKGHATRNILQANGERENEELHSEAFALNQLYENNEIQPDCR
jgi:hypothetical protein